MEKHRNFEFQPEDFQGTDRMEKKEERNFALMTSCKAGFDEFEERRYSFQTHPPKFAATMKDRGQ